MNFDNLRLPSDLRLAAAALRFVEAWEDGTAVGEAISPSGLAGRGWPKSFGLICPLQHELGVYYRSPDGLRYRVKWAARGFGPDGWIDVEVYCGGTTVMVKAMAIRQE